MFYFTNNGLLREAVDESLSINNEVLKTTDLIYRAFTDEFKNGGFQKYSDKLSYKAIYVSCPVFNGGIYKFIFNCYNVLDKGVYDVCKSIYKFGNGETSKSKVTLNIGFLCGTQKTNIKPILQHEIEHIYQIVQGEKLHSHSSYANSVSAYYKALMVLKGGEEYGSPLWKIAYLIYTHSENEEDAFVNQLYSELCDDFDKNHVLETSSAALNYKNGKAYLQEIIADRGTYAGPISEFGFSYDGFIDLYQKMNKRYIRKIGKVIARFENENQPDEILFNDLNIAPGIE